MVVALTVVVVIIINIRQPSYPFFSLPQQYDGCFFFSTSDRASKEVRNAREPDLRVA
jgi:hypothetical protein